MTLPELGYDDWVAQQAASRLLPGCQVARVIAVDREAFLLGHQGGEVVAELAGRLRFAAETAEDLPCVGDWVGMQSHSTGGAAVIVGILPHKTLLRRKSPGRTVQFQMIAANLDVACVMQACGVDFNPARLDRYLVMVRDGGIEPWIVLTKTDLVSPGELDRMMRLAAAGCGAVRVLPISNVTGSGMSEFRSLLAPGKTYCLLGSSGVGKTTLLNRLLGREVSATRAVSGTGEGVHTTARRQLHLLDGGAMLIDTPGMRELGLIGADGGLDDVFGEIRDYAANCRFADCTHTGEPGCAVRQAVDNGSLNAERYRSYQKLRREARYHDLSYAERRKKDKAFGRFLKQAKNRLKK